MIKKYFKIINLKNGIKLIKPTYFSDKRGTIWTSYKSEFFKGLKFNHDRFTLAVKNSLRGLHGDHKTWKLVTCPKGKVFCVIVNYNKQKKNFLKYESFYLSERNKYIILIPPLMLLGWCSLSKKSIFSYKFSYKGDYVDDKDQITVKWNDKRINIKWPINKPILSRRDAF